MHQPHWQRLSKSCTDSNTSTHQSQLQAAEQVLRGLGKQSSTQLNNFCKGFLVSRSYLPSILPNEKETAPTLIGSYQWCKRMFPHILPDFSSWPFSGDTSSFLTNALQMSSHWNQPSQFWFGCCGRYVLLGCVLTTWWAPGGGIKWSYLKRLNKQDMVVSDTFHSRSATCILKSILFAAEHS